MCLGKQDFQSILQDSVIRHLSEDELDTMVLEAETACILVDVRLPMEFRHDRTPGARNLPLNELRREVHNLEKDFFYVVCGDGRRSELGAYILSEAGLNAYVLDRGKATDAKTNGSGLTLFRGALILLLSLAGSLCRANPEPPPPFVIHSLPDQARITIYSEYLRDPSGELDIHTVSQLPAMDHFQPATRYIERLGIRNGHWWVRVAIKTSWVTSTTLPCICAVTRRHSSIYPAPTAYRQLSPQERIPGRGSQLPGAAAYR